MLSRFRTPAVSFSLLQRRCFASVSEEVLKLQKQRKAYEEQVHQARVSMQADLKQKEERKAINKKVESRSSYQPPSKAELSAITGSDDLEFSVLMENIQQAVPYPKRQRDPAAFDAKQRAKIEARKQKLIESARMHAGEAILLDATQEIPFSSAVMPSLASSSNLSVVNAILAAASDEVVLEKGSGSDGRHGGFDRSGDRRGGGARRDDGPRRPYQRRGAPRSEN
jgi:hypothetical protein